MKRTPLSKKIRFEVLKRDGFKCQYCGASAPDVLLEVDHIIPVSRGGTNDILNLITSCHACNSGKSNRELSDKSVVQVQKRQLEEAQERREQLEMIVQWRKELSEVRNTEVDYIVNVFKQETDFNVTATGEQELKRLIKRFGFLEICEATDIAIARYFKGNVYTACIAFDKIGGICYNRKKAREAECQTGS